MPVAATSMLEFRFARFFECHPVATRQPGRRLERAKESGLSGPPQTMSSAKRELTRGLAGAEGDGRC
jgi:hypothetical protein